jgi:hypothetical protein
MRGVKLSIKKSSPSFSVLEIVLAIGLFAIIAGGMAGVVAGAFSTTRLGEETTKAAALASEGLEAVRAIQERDFWVLEPGTFGTSSGGGVWELSGTQNTFGKYTRQLLISNVFRDGGGNIVESGGILDLYTKRVESVVTWNVTPARTNTTRLATYFSYWEATLCVWDTGQVTATLDLPGGGDGTAIEAVEDRVYATTMKNTLGEFFVIDVNDPLVPSIMGIFDVGDHVFDVSILGNYAYLATSQSGKEMIVVDVSDPNNPTEATSFDILESNQAFGISVEGDYAYVVTPQSTKGGELYIFDITNPLAPSLVGELEVNTHVYGVKAKDERVYLATGDVSKELIIVGVTDPTSPVELGSYDIPLAGANGQSVDVVRAGVVYLGTRANAGGIPEFHLLSIADPTNITLIGTYDVSGRVNGVGAGTGFALLASEKAGEEFMILDLSDPKAPVKAFSTSLNGAAGGVAFIEDEEICISYFVTADDGAEFQVVQP